MDFQIGSDHSNEEAASQCGGNYMGDPACWQDFRLKCQTCGHMVMIPRRVVEKGFRGFVEE